MGQNTLGAFIVKRRKILLPALNIENNWNETFWCSTDRKIVNKEILIEAKNERVEEYFLYGTEIPVIFCYPHWHEESRPKMDTCVGVETRKWQVSSSMKENYPNGEFHYNGRYITDEEVIEWLENEKNLESMKKIRERAIQYGKKCKESIEAMEKRKLEEAPKIEAMRRLQKEEQEQKVKKMVNRKNELISRYQ